MVEHDEIKTLRKVAFVLGGGFAISVIAFVVALVVIIQHAQEYAPLGEYPVQRVDSRIPGESVPSVPFSEGEVIVTGTKCAEQSTRIEGRATWTEVVPGGAVIPVPKGTAVRTRGCTTRTFHNEFPAKVIERVRHSAERGRTRTIWQLSGVETAISPDGRPGQKVSWQSQNFTIVYDL